MPISPTEPAQTALKRTLNLPLLTLYGLGTTIGAGIYALLGEIAGAAGYGAPASFLLASATAGFTACSFAELSGRFPRAAGAALYVQRGFGSARAALLVGLAVVAAGVVSSAALVNGFTGYLQQFLAIDRAVAITAAVLVLGGIAAWGIAQSVTVAAIITLVEIAGLVLVIGVGADVFRTLPARWPEFVPGVGGAGWAGVFVGVTLAFYAFIGFEDMVDVAEEVKDVRRTLPRAILLTLGITTFLYLALAVSALLSLTPGELAATNAPLAALYEHHTGSAPILIGSIALFSIINGALVQSVMGARVLYGLASRRQLPAVFARVNPRTRTPLLATACVALLILGLALYGRLATLAAATSMIILSIFATVNLSLWVIKGRETPAGPGVIFPRFVPLVGAVLSIAFVARELVQLAA